MKLYGISGLGADKRVFQYLPLDGEFIPIDWIEPQKKESIEAYALRLSEVIDKEESYGILGVSFGGLIAVEMSKQLHPQLTILISSAETHHELRPIYKLLGKIGLHQLIPQKYFAPPQIIAHWLFGAKNKQLLNQILADTDLKFAKWAVNALLTWDNEEKLNNAVLKISGTKDKLIPAPRDKRVRLIENGAHFMIVDRGEEIGEVVRQKIREI